MKKFLIVVALVSLVVGTAVQAQWDESGVLSRTYLAISTAASTYMTQTLGMTKAAVPDSAAAAFARDILMLRRAAFPDSANAFWARTKVDSTKSDANSLAIGDMAGLTNRLSEKQALVSLAKYGLPIFPDSTGSAQDSTTIKVLSDALNAYYSEHLFVYGNASAAKDTTFILGSFIPPVAPDSLIVWGKASAANADSCSFAFVLRDAAGDVVWNQYAVVAAVVNTWQRFVYEAPVLTPYAPYTLEYRARVNVAADQVWLGPMWGKGN